ncbi:uncharacterized protein [Dermacentor albipictus]|uniref:uncharacterized protein isoform X2 n=1 Tax=Dermacentor albipictus TaxID=60249 RepID=UPI0038FCCEB8
MNFWKPLFICATWLPCIYTAGCPNSLYVEWCPSVKDPTKNPFLSLGEIDPEDYGWSCVMTWCPLVKDPCCNPFICKGGLDPELLQQELETKKDTTTERIETTTKALTTAPAKPVPTRRPSVYFSGWEELPSDDCFDKKKHEPRRNGGPCLVSPDRKSLGSGGECWLGLCWNGICFYPKRGKCATM